MELESWSNNKVIIIKILNWFYAKNNNGLKYLIIIKHINNKKWMM